MYFISQFHKTMQKKKKANKWSFLSLFTLHGYMELVLLTQVCAFDLTQKRGGERKGMAFGMLFGITRSFAKKKSKSRTPEANIYSGLEPYSKG